MEKLGLIHIYHGDGKGKTTASMGLALRAVGFGYDVVVVQFLKDGDSSEITALRSFKNATILSGKDVKGFTFAMNDDEKSIVTQNNNAHLTNAIEMCKNEECDVLILDEILDAVNSNMIDYEMLIGFLESKCGVEIIITGRNPKKELLDLADYVSEIKKIKHPYDRGIKARSGIEM